MNFLDFFAGIGGFRTALDRVGGKCKGFAEIDGHARCSYKAMHDTEGEIEWHDITAVTDDDFRRLRGTIDLIAGGFPCQAFSVAGKRMGFNESRGTLFFHIARAAKKIQPRYLLLENVKGLVSHDQGRTLTVILNTLQELGYGHIEWGIFDSKFWGVPQHRERIFIVAELVDRPQRPYLLDLLKEQEENGVQTKLQDILETEVDEKYYLSDDRMKAIVQKLEDRVVVKEATTHGYAEAFPGDSVNLVQPNSKTRRGRVGRKLAKTLLTSLEQAVIEPKKMDALTEKDPGWPEMTYRVRSLTPLESWRLQGFSDEQHQAAVDAGLSDSQRYKQAGNSVTVNVVEAISRQLMNRFQEVVNERR